jgi:peptidyl-prolyl cis-trans isomerase D
MLRGMNKLGQSWVGKAVVTVLFGFLIVSFAVWGIGDIFRGAVRTDVASVGNAGITADAYRNAYQSEVQRLARQSRQSISPERARALGIDTQVLGRLITEAALDQKARGLGLEVSNELVVKTITEDPNFQGPSGRFERSRFEEVLFSNSLNEATFVREQRAVIARLQLAEAITGALPVPIAMREAVHRYGAERRAADYLMLPASLIGDIAAPTEDQLKTFFQERQATFRAPEYRSVNVLVVDPESIAKPDAVTDADARRRYEEVKASRFGSPERRTVEQMVFPTPEAANAAAKSIAEGVAFEAVAAENNIDPKTLELGTFTKGEIIDPAVAEAAFALSEGGVSGAVQGRFGNVIVRVTKVQPETVKPFEEVATEVKREIALERARGEIETLHDAVEDLRASAQPLTEVARQRELPLVSIPAIDRSGRDKAGNPVQTLPEREALVTAAFGSDVGADNEPLRTRSGGYVWYEVTGVEPARDKTLDEVRGEVAAQWRTEQISRQLGERARTLVERLDKGEALAAIAGELGLQAKSAADLGRGGAKHDLSADVVNRIFAVPVGKAASAAAGDESRVVFKVANATVPPFVTSTSEAERVAEQLRILLSDDLLGQYIAQLQQDLGVSINRDNMRRAIGGES